MLRIAPCDRARRSFPVRRRARPRRLPDGADRANPHGARRSSRPPLDARSARAAAEPVARRRPLARWHRRRGASGRPAAGRRPPARQPGGHEGPSRPRPPATAGPSQCSSTKSVERRPARKSGLAATKRWNGRVVWTPPISVSSRARRGARSPPAGRRRGPSAWRPAGRSRPGPDRPASIPASTLTPGPAGQRQPADAAGSGRNDRGRDPRARSGPRSHGRSGSPGPLARRPAPRPTGGRRPPARAARGRGPCRSTSSVIPCSTWSRALTSRNQKRAGLVEQELGRRRVAQSRGRRRSGRPSSWSSSRWLGRQPRCGRLLDELLVAALDRAVALADGDHPARRRRPAAGPRCGGPAGSRVRGRRRRHRTRPAPRPTRPTSAAARSSAAATRRMPRPPPPAAALTRSG